MKNLAEMEDLTPVIEKFSTIAVQVLEGTQFRWNNKKKTAKIFTGVRNTEKLLINREIQPIFLRMSGKRLHFYPGLRLMFETQDFINKHQ